MFIIHTESPTYLPVYCRRSAGVRTLSALSSQQLLDVGALGLSDFAPSSGSFRCHVIHFVVNRLGNRDYAQSQHDALVKLKQY